VPATVVTVVKQAIAAQDIFQQPAPRPARAVGASSVSETITRDIRGEAPRFRDRDAERAEARQQAQDATRTRDLAWPQTPEIRVCAVGLQAVERSFLDRMVGASKLRQPCLLSLPRAQAHEADVILIDGQQEAALDWACSQDWLARRAVIWIDREPEHPGHTMLRRPVAWPMLQLLLASAIRQAPPRPDELAPRQVQPDAPMVLVLAGDARERHHMRQVLEAAGYRSTLSGTGREGLAALHAGTYACVMLAGDVPDLEVLELCRRLRALEHRIGRLPVLVLDDEPGTVARLRARIAGCDHWLPRPKTARELKAALGDQIEVFAERQRQAAQAALRPYAPLV
jgi:CheY-like chemotaxis protein